MTHDVGMKPKEPIMILSTARRRRRRLARPRTPQIEGHTIREYKGIVTGETIIGANMFKDLFAGIRDIVGGRAGSYEKVLAEAKDTSMQEMMQRAQAMGANAIVGICSTNLPDIDYYRNTDYLPMPIHESTKGKGLFKYEQGYGRSGDLKKFLKNELMPYIDKNYRTSGRTIGIGHSLSASFVLDCMVTDDLFDDYIAMSPNCYFDEFRVASGIEQYMEWQLCHEVHDMTG